MQQPLVLERMPECWPKVTYPTLQRAQYTLDCWEKRGKDVVIYPCPHCSGFHIAIEPYLQK